MRRTDRIYLGEIKMGDRYPFFYFELHEWIYDTASSKMVLQPLDLALLNLKKFSSRHVDNKLDFNDHTLDDIYQDLTVDGTNVCHYEWAALDTDVLGKYIVRLHFQRTSDSRQFHSMKEWEYDVVSKMPGSFGAIR